jgi:hypothetical protein
MAWIHRAKDRHKWEAALVNAVTGLQFHEMRGISCLAQKLASSHKKTVLQGFSYNYPFPSLKKQFSIRRPNVN